METFPVADHSAHYALVGPTASGKTAVALRLAERLPLEVISVDSRQVYRLMDIGTAKPSPEERLRVVHHLIDVIDPDETYNAGRFAAEAARAAAAIRAAGKIPFLVGGTGLYLKAFAEGLINAPPADSNVRRRLRDEAEAAGLPVLHRRLAEADPEAAARIHPNDPVRVIRALEILELTGMGPTALLLRTKPAPLNLTVFGLNVPRPILYDRIRHRTRAMVVSGLAAEVEHLLSLGYGEDLPAMRGIGYRQMISFLAGRCRLDEATADTIVKTRNYAKRQMTWFSAAGDIRWLDASSPGEADKAAATIEAHIHAGESHGC